jgi:hypothetical protein
MAGIIHLGCKNCDGEIVFSAEMIPHILCSYCKQPLHLAIDTFPPAGSSPTACLGCGHTDFYVQKDFNRNLGLAIVVIGIAVSLYFFSQNKPMLAMGALGLTAVVDFLTFYLVGEVAVCYACHAVYRGFERNPEHEAFDLKKLEKYGGRSPRVQGK